MEQYLDTATHFLFGESFDSLSGETSQEARDFLTAFDHAMLGSGIRIALGPLKFLYKTSSWLDSCQTTHRFANKLVDKAVRRRQTDSAKTGNLSDHDQVSTKSHALLYSMAEATEERLVLRNEILQALMAAQETTAALISNVFFLLSRHQAEWLTLQEEVQQNKNSTLNAETLMSMKHLRNVLNEGEFPH